MDEFLNIAVLESSDSDSDLEDVIILNNFNNRHNFNGNRADIYGVFNLQERSDKECKLYFRFEKDDIPRLAQALRIPEEFSTDNGLKASAIEGLCILLRRLSYPNRLSDLEPLFRRSGPAISKIIDYMVNHIYNNFGHNLADIRNLQWLTLEKFRIYARAVQDKEAPVPNCWGFIDGTTRGICRPTENQEAYYSGHKRYHCVKYQAVISPDGIIINLKGGYEGRKHDAGIFRESHLYTQLEECAVFPNEVFILYGDMAYGITELLLCPYPNHRHMAPEHEEFNRRMSEARVAVEWGFGKVVAEFAFLDFKKNQKLLLQEVASMYTVAVILINCHTCLYGSQTGFHFNVNPIELEEYLQ